MDSNYSYEWQMLPLPYLDMTLDLRTIKSRVALLESHVGEELWDAAKIFCAHLCYTYKHDVSDQSIENDSFLHVNARNLKGKTVLELGSGVAPLGMCAVALGAKHVICTDYDVNVLENLEFNLLHNRERLMAATNKDDKDFEDVLHHSKLDWQWFASDDVQSAEWLESRNVNSSGLNINVNERNETPMVALEPDILIGSALVYSVEGALYLADTLKHFLVDGVTSECWILQMPSRPGFDRFLLRLEKWGLIYESYEIDEQVWGLAHRHMKNIASSIDDFRIYVIKKRKEP